MILDRKFDGTQDQGNGHLIIFETPTSTVAYFVFNKNQNLYPNALSTLDNMNKVVDKLFERTNQLKSVE